MRNPIIATLAGALMLATGASLAQNAAPNPMAVQAAIKSTPVTQTAPAQRAHWRQAILVDGLHVKGASDELARDVPAALGRAGFALGNARADSRAIAAAIRRLIASGVPAEEVVVLARGPQVGAALDAATLLGLPAVNWVLIDGCDDLRARAAALPVAHMLAIGTGRQAMEDRCGLPAATDAGRPRLESVKLPPAGKATPLGRAEPDALARAIASWIAPPQFPDDPN